MSVQKLPVRRKGKVVVRKGPGDCLWCWQSSFSCPKWWMCGCSLYCIHVFGKLYIWIYVLFCMCTHTLLLFKNKGRRIKLSSLNGSFHWWIAVAGTWPTEITEWPGYTSWKGRHGKYFRTIHLGAEDTQSPRLLERMSWVGFFVYHSSFSCNSSWHQAFI